MKTTWTWFLDVSLCALAGGALAGCPMDDDDPFSASTSSTGGAETTNAASTGAAESTSTAVSTTTDDPASSTTSVETSDSDTSSSGSSTGATETGSPAYAVSGSVTRSAVLPRGGDGIGTLVVAAFAECTLQAPVVLGATIVPGADLSTDDAAVDFTIEPLPDGPVFLVSFLDDDGNLDPNNPLPDDGDPVLAEGVGDGILTCIEVQIDRNDVMGVAVDLNEIAMPQG